MNDICGVDNFLAKVVTPICYSEVRMLRINWPLTSGKGSSILTFVVNF